jgi:hypothetical protein
MLYLWGPEPCLQDMENARRRILVMAYPPGDGSCHRSAFCELKGLGPMTYVMIPYRQEDHGDVGAEWPPHKKVPGRWYIPGSLARLSSPADLCCSQVTWRRPRLFGRIATILQWVLADFQTGSHRLTQEVRVRRRDTFARQGVVHYAPAGRRERQQGVGHTHPLHTRLWLPRPTMSRKPEARRQEAERLLGRAEAEREPAEAERQRREQRAALYEEAQPLARAPPARPGNGTRGGRAGLD